MAAHAASSSPRAQRTRAALLGAGLDLLADRPIDAIAIDEVVARAGVAKGSFFNHFADKQAFADAISSVVRSEVEHLVSRVNHGIADPLERLAGGMIAAALFASNEPRRAAVLVRATTRMAPSDHPINRGLRADLEAAASERLIDPATLADAVHYWLTCCQAALSLAVDAANTPASAREKVSGMLRLGLRGLGAVPEHITRVTDPESIRDRFALRIFPSTGDQVTKTQLALR